MNKKVVALVLACVLIFSTVVAGTLAWLQSQTAPVVNTFTFGNIDITLTETVDQGGDGAEQFKLIPGQEIEKDPVVTVEKGSEACWIYVEVTESANLGDFVTYDMADGWTNITGNIWAYDTAVAANANADQTFYALKGSQTYANGCVACIEDVEKDAVDALETSGNYPTLTFVAYAVQQTAGATAEAAWNATYGAPVTP